MREPENDFDLSGFTGAELTLPAVVHLCNFKHPDARKGKQKKVKAENGGLSAKGRLDPLRHKDPKGPSSKLRNKGQVSLFHGWVSGRGGIQKANWNENSGTLPRNGNNPDSGIWELIRGCGGEATRNLPCMLEVRGPQRVIVCEAGVREGTISERTVRRQKLKKKGDTGKMSGSRRRENHLWTNDSPGRASWARRGR